MNEFSKNEKNRPDSALFKTVQDGSFSNLIQRDGSAPTVHTRYRNQQQLMTEAPLFEGWEDDTLEDHFLHDDKHEQCWDAR